MRIDCAVTRMSSDRVAMRPIVNRMTVKILPSLAVGGNVFLLGFRIKKAIFDSLSVCPNV